MTKLLVCTTIGTFLFGQTLAPMGMPTWAGNAANLSAIGMMIYLLYHIIVKAMPKMADDHREERQQAESEHRDERADALVRVTAELQQCRMRNGE